MDFNLISVLVFLLTFVPGYLCLNIIDYLLLNGGKSQLEKITQGILISVLIWMPFFIFPIFSEQKAILFNFAIETSMRNENIDHERIVDAIKAGLCIYASVLGVSVIMGIFFGRIRRCKKVDNIFRCITSRDRHKTVPLRFFTEYIFSTVRIINSSGKYEGILAGTPDRPNVSEDPNAFDVAIMLYNTKIIDGSHEKDLCPVSLFYVRDITHIEMIKRRTKAIPSQKGKKEAKTRE